jgi:hypothetical protein
VKIIRWYENEYPGQDGIDWNDMKSKVQNKEFLFMNKDGCFFHGVEIGKSELFF